MRSFAVAALVAALSTGAVAAPLSTQSYTTDAAFLAAITPGTVHDAIGEFRWGGTTTWEVGIGANTQQSAKQVNAHTTWSGPKTFNLSYNGSGGLTLDFAGTSSFLTYPGATMKPAIDPSAFNALALRADGRKGDVTISDLMFNSMAFGPLVSTTSVEYLVLAGANVQSPWNLSGTINFAAQADNGGSQPSFQIKLADVPQVPLPAAVWSLLAALAGLGVIGRRRHSAEA